MNDVQASLKSWRLRARVSQSDLAAELQVTQSHLSKVEALKTGVTLDLVDSYLRRVGGRLIVVPDEPARRDDLVAVIESLPDDRAAVVLLLASVISDAPSVLVEDLAATLRNWKKRYQR